VNLDRLAVEIEAGLGRWRLGVGGRAMECGLYHGDGSAAAAAAAAAAGAATAFSRLIAVLPLVLEHIGVGRR
jgi:hypothetical protein